MKNLKSILSILVMVFILALASCSGNGDSEQGASNLEGFNNRITESLSSVKSINYKASITDGTMKVYDLSRTITINEVTEDGLCSGTNNSTIQQLSIGFQLTTSREYADFIEVEVNNLFNINLSEEVLGTYTLDNGTLSGVVSLDKATNFFGEALSTVSGDITYSIVLVDLKLTTYSCSYTTTSNRSVEITATYNY